MDRYGTSNSADAGSIPAKGANSRQCPKAGELASKSCWLGSIPKLIANAIGKALKPVRRAA